MTYFETVTGRVASGEVVTGPGLTDVDLEFDTRAPGSVKVESP